MSPLRSPAPNWSSSTVSQRYRYLLCACWRHSGSVWCAVKPGDRLQAARETESERKRETGGGGGGGGVVRPSRNKLTQTRGRLNRRLQGVISESLLCGAGASVAAAAAAMNAVDGRRWAQSLVSRLSLSLPLVLVVFLGHSPTVPVTFPPSPAHLLFPQHTHRSHFGIQHLTSLWWHLFQPLSALSLSKLFYPTTTTTSNHYPVASSSVGLSLFAQNNPLWPGFLFSLQHNNNHQTKCRTNIQDRLSDCSKPRLK